MSNFPSFSFFHLTIRTLSLFQTSRLGCMRRVSESSLEFNPYNFLDEQGKLEKHESFMPFSVGPRMLLEEGLTRMELFLILVTLLHPFQFVCPEDAREPDYTPVFGVTRAPKPYKVVVYI
uniref:Uncharacterized protein n=1 Tax=Hucho hucho TaxID=62062 RepID=A0A4W5LFT3_9TELE